MEQYTEGGRFEGKTILVTGGTSGIGRATALRASMEGANVVFVGRNSQRGEDVASEIIQLGGRAIFIKCDVSNPKDVESMVSETIKNFGNLNIAINNAGIMGNPQPCHNLSDDDWFSLINGNLTSIFNCCREELRTFIKQGIGGAIINIASVAGITGLPGNAGYISSKHGVVGLTKSIAVDYAKYNIRCNAVCPAGVDTAMTDAVKDIMKERYNEAAAKGMELKDISSMASGKIQSLQGRNASADEQAAVILFLASDDASNITGCILPVDGGWTTY